MSSCVITANPDSIILISILFISLLLFPYVTLTTQFVRMLQSFAFKPIFDYVMSPKTVLYKKFSFFSKIMYKFSSCSRVKVGLLLSKKNCFIYFHENPLKMIKNVFYFILKDFFVVKIFTFLFSDFSQIEKTAWLEWSGQFQNLWRYNLVNKQLRYTYWPISHEVKPIRQWNLVS